MIMMKVHSLQRHIEARKKKHMVVEFSVLQKSVKNNFKINISKISSFVDINGAALIRCGAIKTGRNIDRMQQFSIGCGAAFNR